MSDAAERAARIAEKKLSAPNSRAAQPLPRIADGSADR